MQLHAPGSIPRLGVIIVHIAVACDLMRQQQGPSLWALRALRAAAARRVCARNKSTHRAAASGEGRSQTRLPELGNGFASLGFRV